MRLAAREDVEAPLAFVFAALADTDHWERAALRRGAEVQRTDRLAGVGPGMAWAVAFVWRGRRRQGTLVLTEFQPDQRLAFRATGEMLEATAAFDLIEMGPRRTRLVLVAEVKPRTLKGRLYLQGARLARARIETRLAQRMAQLASDLELRNRRSAAR